MKERKRQRKEKMEEVLSKLNENDNVPNNL